MPVSFTEKDAKDCPGTWIVRCNSCGCDFSAVLEASGSDDAIQKGKTGHMKVYTGFCTGQTLLVGKVPEQR